MQHETTLNEELRNIFDPEKIGLKTNPELYNDYALLCRDSIRYDSIVVAAIDELWKVVDLDKQGELYFKEYQELHTRLTKIFLPYTSEKLAKQYLQNDWTRDKDAEKNVVTRIKFSSSIFELADLWTGNEIDVL